jgi:hypothetical protein
MRLWSFCHGFIDLRISVKIALTYISRFVKVKSGNGLYYLPEMGYNEVTLKEMALK